MTFAKQHHGCFSKLPSPSSEQHIYSIHQDSSFSRLFPVSPQISRLGIVGAKPALLQARQRLLQGPTPELRGHMAQAGAGRLPSRRQPMGESFPVPFCPGPSTKNSPPFIDSPWRLQDWGSAVLSAPHSPLHPSLSRHLAHAENCAAAVKRGAVHTRKRESGATSDQCSWTKTSRNPCKRQTNYSMYTPTRL